MTRARLKALCAGEAEAAPEFVFVTDGGGVVVADAVLVGKPVRSLFAAQERGPGFEVGEPFG